MLDNCSYNKIKLMHNLSQISWYMHQYCQKDAQACKQGGCCELFKSIQKTLDEQIETLQKAMKL